MMRRYTDRVDLSMQNLLRMLDSSKKESCISSRRYTDLDLACKLGWRKGNWN